MSYPGQMKRDLFLLNFPEASSIYKAAPDREIFRLDDRIYKVFENIAELEWEWKQLQIYGQVYPTRYTEQAKIDWDMSYISFPSLRKVYRVNDKLIHDIQEQLDKLNQEDLMHLDVSLDNVLFDPLQKKYYLIDYGLASSYQTMVENMAKYPGFQAYKPQYRDPRGFSRHSDRYALSVLAGLMEE